MMEMREFMQSNGNYVMAFFSVAFLLSAFKIALDDLKTRYVGVVEFFVFQILSAIVTYLVFGSVGAASAILAVFVTHFGLQILSEKVERVGTYLGNDWKVGSIAIFDYFLYAIVAIVAMAGVLTNGMYAMAFMWLSTFFAFVTGYVLQKRNSVFYREDADGIQEPTIPLFMYLNFFLAFFIISNTILRFF